MSVEAAGSSIADLRVRFGREAASGFRFVLKLLAATCLVAIGVSMVVAFNTYVAIGGMVVLGFTFAHVAELQHEALHRLAFRGRRLNEVAGIVLGVPMLVSFAAYQATHLRHHRYLGTSRNKEFFDYGDADDGAPVQRRRRVQRLLVRFFMPKHYRQFGVNLWRTVRGRAIDGESELTSRRVRRDYWVIAVTVAVLVGLSIVLRQPLIVTLWLIPLVVVACPVHALIEWPEHYGCDVDISDPFRNTRTIRSNALMAWFVNKNNFHVEHHLMPRLPFRKLGALHDNVSERLTYLEPTYRSALHTMVESAPARTSGAGRVDDPTTTRQP